MRPRQRSTCFIWRPSTSLRWRSGVSTYGRRSRLGRGVRYKVSVWIYHIARRRYRRRKIRWRTLVTLHSCVILTYENGPRTLSERDLSCLCYRRGFDFMRRHYEFLLGGQHTSMRQRSVHASSRYRSVCSMQGPRRYVTSRVPCR